MSYCLNTKFKAEMIRSYGITFNKVLEAERMDTQKYKVSIGRQLYLALLTARTINENYYHNLAGQWVPSLRVKLDRVPSGEKVILVEVSAIHKAGFGLWN